MVLFLFNRFQWSVPTGGNCQNKGHWIRQRNNAEYILYNLGNVRKFLGGAAAMSLHQIWASPGKFVSDVFSYKLCTNHIICKIHLVLSTFFTFCPLHFKHCTALFKQIFFHMFIVHIFLLFYFYRTCIFFLFTPLYFLLFIKIPRQISCMWKHNSDSKHRVKNVPFYSAP